jgi:glycosyltransferase involved in cell wall biosynthesis
MLPGLPIPVLYVLNTLGYGGTERQLVLTLEALDRNAFSPSVLALFKGGPYEQELRELGIPTAVLGVKKRALLSSARAVEDAARRHGARIIHGSLFESNVASRLAARRVGAIPVTHLVNELAPLHRKGEPEERTRLKARGAELIDRVTSRWSGTRFVAVAEVVADSAARFYRVPRASIPVVRRGFDFRALDEAAGKPVQESPWSEWADPRLLAVGRLSPQKGHRYLVRALPRIVERFPKAQAVVVGNGPLGGELETIARRSGADDSLLLAGTRRDVPALIRQADVFVFPSLWEGAAGALVEAVTLGTPVVASDIAANREIADRDLVTFVRPKDPRALSEAIAEVVGDLEGVRVRASRAAVAARAAHDIAANTRTLEACYRRFLDMPFARERG